MKHDVIYTPAPIAQQLVDAARSSFNGYIADFTAGDGSLLVQARTRWPEGKIAATDLDRHAIGRLLIQIPDAFTGTCNFLRCASRRNCKVLRTVKGQVSLVLLNPPFSCRGARTVHTRFGDVDVRCSTAMAFVLGALDYLDPNGELIAVLPASCLTSIKDRTAREILISRFAFEIVDRISKYAFKGHVASCCVVKLITRRNAPALNGETVTLTAHEGSSAVSHIVPFLPYDVRVVRGSVQMHSLIIGSENNSLPLIHTTELKAGTVSLPHGRLSDKIERALQGPAVLLPRVGRPDANKVCVWNGDIPLVLSDCIIALCCRSAAAARSLRDVICASWPAFSSLYGGTGAKYLVLDDVIAWLKRAGFRVHELRKPQGIAGIVGDCAEQEHVEIYQKAEDAPVSSSLLGRPVGFNGLT